MSQVGFDLSGNSGESVLVTVEAYSNGQLMPTGQLQFDIVANSPTTIFAGIRDLQGIDTLVLKGIPASGTQGFIMDNLRFEAAAAVVPEPSAALLFPAGLALAASCVRRRQRKLA
jgi:hypothetical protein